MRFLTYAFVITLASGFPARAATGKTEFLMELILAQATESVALESATTKGGAKHYVAFSLNKNSGQKCEITKLKFDEWIKEGLVLFEKLQEVPQRMQCAQSFRVSDATKKKLGKLEACIEDLSAEQNELTTEWYAKVKGACVRLPQSAKRKKRSSTERYLNPHRKTAER